MWREPTSLISLSQLLGESTFLRKPNECEGLAKFRFQERRRTAAVEKDSEKGRMSVQASISHTTGKEKQTKRKMRWQRAAAARSMTLRLGAKKKANKIRHNSRTIIGHVMPDSL